MRITRLFVLLALAALLAPPAEASRTSVWERNPPSYLTATTTDAAGLLASLAPAARLDASALPDIEAAEAPLFDLGDVVLADTEREQRFNLGPLTLVDLNLLRGPPPSYPETRVGGFELLPPFRVGASTSLSLWGRQACGFSCREVASDSRYDPWGLMTLREAGDIALDTLDGIFNPRNLWKNTKRQFGGGIGVGKAALTPAIENAKMAMDTVGVLAGSDAAADRWVERGSSLLDAVRHPVDTMVKGHSDAIERIEAHEGAGEHFKSGMVAGEMGANDAAVVVGGAEGGVAAARAAGTGVRSALQPVFRKLATQPRVLARGRPLTPGDKARRFLLQDTRRYPAVGYSPIGRALKKAFSSTNWDQHHVFVQRKWYRQGSASQWYPSDPLANEGLRRVGDAGWNLMPIPRQLNQAMGRSAAGTASFAGGVVGGTAGATAFTIFETFDDE